MSQHAAVQQHGWKFNIHCFSETETTDMLLSMNINKQHTFHDAGFSCLVISNVSALETNWTVKFVLQVSSWTKVHVIRYIHIITMTSPVSCHNIQRTCWSSAGVPWSQPSPWLRTGWTWSSFQCNRLLPLLQQLITFWYLKNNRHTNNTIKIENRNVE